MTLDEIRKNLYTEEKEKPFLHHIYICVAAGCLSFHSDKVLKALVQTIQAHSRRSDILIRWGGEEFILMIPINNKANLYKRLNSLREVIEQQRVPSVDNITVSIGAAIHSKADSIEDTIKHADNNLYSSKKNGRNQTTVD